MDQRGATFDWTQARAFVAAAEAGSFSAAARALGSTQPTVGRQVAALEAALGVTLFERVGKALALTEAGTDLLGHARRMSDAAADFALAARGRAQSAEGWARISATDFAAAFHLPRVLPRLRALAPRVQIEILAESAISDLRRREADIAIRHVRPEQPDLVARRLPDSRARLYASTGYLDRRGRPETLSDLAAHDFIAHSAPDRVAATYAALEMPIRREQFCCASENGVVLIELLRAGLGVMMMLDDVVARAGGDDLEVVLPDRAPILVPVWLVAHRELKTSRRVRIVFDALADAFAEGF